MPKFNPDWEIDYLFKRSEPLYCVIKRPEPLPGEKTLMVQEGCTVYPDARWYYWRLPKPVSYENWKKNNGWSDLAKKEPDKVVAAKLNHGQPGQIPAPEFRPQEDNNWIGEDRRIVPDYVTIEMLGDLMLAHLQLCDELREGKPLQKAAA